MKIAIGDLDLLVEVNIKLFYISEIARDSKQMHATTLKDSNTCQRMIPL